MSETGDAGGELTLETTYEADSDETDTDDMIDSLYEKEYEDWMGGGMIPDSITPKG